MHCIHWEDGIKRDTHLRSPLFALAIHDILVQYLNTIVSEV